MSKYPFNDEHRAITTLTYNATIAISDYLYYSTVVPYKSVEENEVDQFTG